MWGQATRREGIFGNPWGQFLGTESEVEKWKIRKGWRGRGQKRALRKVEG